MRDLKDETALNGASICRRAAGNCPSKDSGNMRECHLGDRHTCRQASPRSSGTDTSGAYRAAPAHYQEMAVTALAKQMEVTASLTQQMEAMTRKLDNLTVNAANTQGPRSPRRFLGNCWNCGERGHVSPQLYGNGSNIVALLVARLAIKALQCTASGLTVDYRFNLISPQRRIRLN